MLIILSLKYKMNGSMFGTEIALIAFARCKWVFAMELQLNRSSVPNRFFFPWDRLKIRIDVFIQHYILHI